MTVVMFVFIIIFLLIGYYMMHRLDAYLAGHSFHSDDKDTVPNALNASDIMLIYGDNEIADMTKKYCAMKHYPYETIHDVSEFQPDCSESTLLVLSNKDSNNLMLGSIASKIYNLSSIIILCNQSNHLKIFKEYNFYKILFKDNDFPYLYESIKELIDDVHNKKIQSDIF
ncbi:MAG: hypothetical protein CVU98_13790 [Firmicutes bacterium HGW-Firmicutes-3]|jgi:hypothetical protein|nr:MAG: hypothetical protein CVU98_13790 [Firmicutes bacterium HGW-Firmicutes-3]